MVCPVSSVDVLATRKVDDMHMLLAVLLLLVYIRV